MAIPVWLGWVLLPIMALLTISSFRHGRWLWGLLGILIFFSSIGAVIDATSHGGKLCIGHYATSC